MFNRQINYKWHFPWLCVIIRQTATNIKFRFNIGRASPKTTRPQPFKGWDLVWCLPGLTSHVYPCLMFKSMLKPLVCHGVNGNFRILKRSYCTIFPPIFCGEIPLDQVGTSNFGTWNGQKSWAALYFLKPTTTLPEDPIRCAGKTHQTAEISLWNSVQRCSCTAQAWLLSLHRFPFFLEPETQPWHRLRRGSVYGRAVVAKVLG